MAITPKPKQNSQETKPAVDVEALIQKGGSVAQNGSEPKKNSFVPVLIRIPTPIAERLDAVLRARPIPKPRTMWILEAILEKLDQEDAI